MDRRYVELPPRGHSPSLPVVRAARMLSALLWQSPSSSSTRCGRYGWQAQLFFCAVHAQTRGALIEMSASRTNRGFRRGVCVCVCECVFYPLGSLTPGSRISPWLDYQMVGTLHRTTQGKLRHRQRAAHPLLTQLPNCRRHVHSYNNGYALPYRGGGGSVAFV